MRTSWSDRSGVRNNEVHDREHANEPTSCSPICVSAQHLPVIKTTCSQGRRSTTPLLHHVHGLSLNRDSPAEVDRRSSPQLAGLARSTAPRTGCSAAQARLKARIHKSLILGRENMDSAPALLPRLCGGL